MDAKTVSLLKLFYKDRAKSGKKSVYEYNPDGDMVEMDKSKTTVVRTVLALNEYRSLTEDEQKEMEEARHEAIAIAVKEYDDAVMRLNQEASSSTRSDKEYMKLNREVAIADERLQQVRFPMRYVLTNDFLTQHDLLFNHDKRVLPYKVHLMQTRPFPLQDMYVRIGKEAEKPLLTIQEIKKAQKTQNLLNRPVILFSSQENDPYRFLSLAWSVSIEFNGTTYHSAIQAIAVEMAKRLNDSARMAEFMAIEDPNQIHYTIKDVSVDRPDLITEWAKHIVQLVYEINTLKFTKYPALALRLMETNDAILGAIEPNDVLLGIGMSMDDPNAKNTLNWKGQNILGKALMDIRNIVRATSASSTAAASNPTESATASIAEPSVVSSAVEAAPMPSLSRGSRVIRRAKKEANTSTVASIPMEAIASNPLSVTASLPSSAATSANVQ